MTTELCKVIIIKAYRRSPCCKQTLPWHSTNIAHKVSHQNALSIKSLNFKLPSYKVALPACAGTVLPLHKTNAPCGNWPSGTMVHNIHTTENFSIQYRISYSNYCLLPLCKLLIPDSTAYNIYSWNVKRISRGFEEKKRCIWTTKSIYVSV